MIVLLMSSSCDYGALISWYSVVLFPLIILIKNPVTRNSWSISWFISFLPEYFKDISHDWDITDLFTWFSITSMYCCVTEWAAPYPQPPPPLEVDSPPEAVWPPEVSHTSRYVVTKNGNNMIFVIHNIQWNFDRSWKKLKTLLFIMLINSWIYF